MTLLVVALAPTGSLAQQCLCGTTSSVTDEVFTRRTVVTNEAKGARCAIAADLDGDGYMDIVSASSTDNTVAWYRNLGTGWSTTNDITYLSNGARIVTTGDIDGDGDVDVVAASYYDDTIRWFENNGFGTFVQTHIITTTALNAQGVHVADLDGDGDLDLVSASSGDNTVAVYINVYRGTFCEIKRLVDTNAIGVRTVVAADLDGDGDYDLASASKDDNVVAWYPNDGAAGFSEKIVISDTSMGAYSLVALDIEGDGDMDLIVASNGDDTVALWRNEGTGVFTKTVIFAYADFVLSVTAFDFDRDGDLDVASASYFDGYVRWYENLDGIGTRWVNHTLYVGAQGHYVSTGDMDNDGDADLIAVTKSENRVQIFYAATGCDVGGDAGSGVSVGADRASCCHLGQQWDGAYCVACVTGTYGVVDGSGVARCVACPSTCTIPGLSVLPATCSATTGCPDAQASAVECDCAANEYKANDTDTCLACPSGYKKPESPLRPFESFADDTMWHGLLNTCELEGLDIVPIAAGSSAGVVFFLGCFLVFWYVVRGQKRRLRQEKRMADQEKEKSIVDKRAAEEARRMVQLRQAMALDLIADLVMEVCVSDWAKPDETCTIEQANETYKDLFGVDWSTAPGAWPALAADVSELRSVLVRSTQRSARAEVRFTMPDGKEKSVRVSTVHSADYHVDRLLVVCHDLTPFKERVELMQDRELISVLQHEEKNNNQSIELDVRRALERLRVVREQLVPEAAATSKGEDESGRLEETSIYYKTVSVSLDDAEAILHDTEARARRAQQQAHARVMLRQLGRDDYVPARSPVDVVAQLRMQLGRASEVKIVVPPDMPEVMLDWNLFWHAIANALSNARKYGDNMLICLELQYAAPRLTLLVVNSVDKSAQARLIASHGHDGTKLLHGRIDGGTSMSTNLGSRAILAAARLLGGSVAMAFEAAETRLRLEVDAPKAKELPGAGDMEPVSVWFVDDEPSMRMRYRSWLQPPFDPATCRVLPDDDMSDEDADEAMRQFARDVLAADPRPACVVLDQNLESKMVSMTNVTTGTALAQQLRAGGFKGKVAIRTADVSRTIIKDFSAAGADHVLSKAGTRDALVRALFGGEDGDEDAAKEAEETNDDDMKEGDMPFCAKPLAAPMIRAFDTSSHKAIVDLRSALAEEKSFKSALHRIAGTCACLHAPRMEKRARALQQAEAITPEDIDSLELMRNSTIDAMRKISENAQTAKV